MRLNRQRITFLAEVLTFVVIAVVLALSFDGDPVRTANDIASPWAEPI